MDKKKRLARLPPRPAPVAFDIDRMIVSALASKAEHMRRMWVGKDFSGVENRIIRGNSFHSMIMDELVAHEPKRTSHEQLANRDYLSLDEWRWAVAFRIYMGVNERFYEQQPTEIRRHIEAKYEALATKNSIVGKSAARIVAHRVKMVMEEVKRPRSQADDFMDAMKTSIRGSVSGRTDQQLAMYAALATQITEPKK